MKRWDSDGVISSDANNANAANDANASPLWRIKAFLKLAGRFRARFVISTRPAADSGVHTSKDEL